MNDRDWNAEGLRLAGKAGHAPRFRLTVRLVGAMAAACLFLVVLYPWGSSFSSEANWLRGPLWLFKVQATTDKLIGGIVAAILTPLIFAVVVKPGRLTAAISVVGILAWIGFGIWLASMAAC